MDLSEDALLDGAVRLLQPKRGYRVTSDSVLLAALAPLYSEQRIIEFGTGYGQVALCLAARQQECHITAFELLPEVAELAQRNVTLNQRQSQIEVCVGDVRGLTGLEADLVIANPPYRSLATHTVSSDVIKAAATAEQALGDVLAWAQAARRLLKPLGTYLIIHDAARLPEIGEALQAAGFGAVQVLPLLAAAGEPPKRIVIRAVAGPVYSCVWLAGLVLHAAGGGRPPEIEVALRAPVGLDAVWQDQVAPSRQAAQAVRE